MGAERAAVDGREGRARHRGYLGLGIAAAEGFACLGATIWLAARSEQRGERARAQIAARYPGSDVRVGLCDLSDLESVRQFAELLGGETRRLDVLVNNAGTLARERTLSVDGIELTFATNVLGPFLLTNLLLPLLEQSKPARIINVSSGGMYTQRIHLDDLQMAHEEFDGPTAYARTKRAQVILTELWAERLRDRSVVVHAMHPGWADTPGLESSLPRFYALTKRLLRTPQEGADTILWLGAGARGARSSGGFWHDRRERPTHRVPCDQADIPGPRAAVGRMRTPQRLARNINPGRFRPIRRHLMAHYNASVDTSRPPDEMFAYLSDFSSTQEWDPGVIEAERLGDAPGQEGTEFRLLASFLHRKIPLTYRVVEYDPPSAVTFRGESSTVVSLDRITFEPSEIGTRITYDADLALKGPFKLADPLLALAFKRVGARALTGLHKTLRASH